MIYLFIILLWQKYVLNPHNIYFLQNICVRLIFAFAEMHRYVSSISVHTHAVGIVVSTCLEEVGLILFALDTHQLN